MRGLRVHLVVVVIFLSCFGGVASAESTANGKAAITPATAPSGPFENTPLKFTASAPAGSAGKPTESKGWDLARIPLALGAVIALILALRWMGKGLAGVTSNKNGGRGVQVLSRSVISPREKMLVVQFGRKLLLVGSTGAEMTRLCQLDDPDEVAEVLSQLRADKSTGASRNFRSAFSGAGKVYESPDVLPAPPRLEASTEVSAEDAAEPEAGGDLAGLMARIRKMQDQFQES